MNIFIILFLKRTLEQKVLETAVYKLGVRFHYIEHILYFGATAKH